MLITDLCLSILVCLDLLWCHIGRNSPKFISSHCLRIKITIFICLCKLEHGLQDLKALAIFALVEHAAQRFEIRVILQLVVVHVNGEHPYFVLLIRHSPAHLLHLFHQLGGLHFLHFVVLEVDAAYNLLLQPNLRQDCTSASCSDLLVGFFEESKMHQQLLLSESLLRQVPYSL
jgi:hypothetical protein